MGLTIYPLYSVASLLWGKLLATGGSAVLMPEVDYIVCHTLRIMHLKDDEENLVKSL